LPADLSWTDGLLRWGGATLAGLALGLLIAAALKLREGVRVNGRVVAFTLFLLLESPTLTYVGLLAGAGTGVYLLREMLAPLPPEQLASLRGLLVPVVGAAAVAGLLFGLLKQVQAPFARAGLVLALAASLAVVGLAYLGKLQVSWLAIQPVTVGDLTPFAYLLLLGVPFFYLLTFAGYEEESEIEIAVICGLLAVALAILIGEQRQYQSAVYLLPLALYFVYTLRVLPSLRVLKHVFRGLGYARGGRFRKALLAFRRALQLEPNNQLARDGFWEVHRSLDVDRLANDPQTLALVDLDLCLDRAGGLLLQKPTPPQLEEASRLLDLVVRLQPTRQPQGEYWRAVAATHAGDVDLAARLLARILDPAPHGPDAPARLAVLLPAWQLALILHPQLRERVGEPQLRHPGRRMEAIAAVERHLAVSPGDETAIALK
jgi:tetratricopeptide (TPR) repeat protein